MDEARTTPPARSHASQTMASVGARTSDVGQVRRAGTGFGSCPEKYLPSSCNRRLFATYGSGDGHAFGRDEVAGC